MVAHFRPRPVMVAGKYHQTVFLMCHRKDTHHEKATAHLPARVEFRRNQRRDHLAAHIATQPERRPGQNEDGGNRSRGDYQANSKGEAHKLSQQQDI